MHKSHHILKAVRKFINKSVFFLTLNDSRWETKNVIGGTFEYTQKGSISWNFVGPSSKLYDWDDRHNYCRLMPECLGIPIVTLADLSFIYLNACIISNMVQSILFTADCLIVVIEISHSVLIATTCCHRFLFLVKDTTVEWQVFICQHIIFRQRPDQAQIATIKYQIRAGSWLLEPN